MQMRAMLRLLTRQQQFPSGTVFAAPCGFHVRSVQELLASEEKEEHLAARIRGVVANLSMNSGSREVVAAVDEDICPSRLLLILTLASEFLFGLPTNFWTGSASGNTYFVSPSQAPRNLRHRCASLFCTEASSSSSASDGFILAIACGTPPCAASRAVRVCCRQTLFHCNSPMAA